MSLTRFHLTQQAYILTSNMMELASAIDPYGPHFPDPEVIQAVTDMMNDLKQGNVADYIEQIDEIRTNNEDCEEIAKDAADLIEELKEYKKAYEEVTK